MLESRWAELRLGRVKPTPGTHSRCLLSGCLAVWHCQWPQSLAPRANKSSQTVPYLIPPDEDGQGPEYLVPPPCRCRCDVAGVAAGTPGVYGISQIACCENWTWGFVGCQPRNGQKRGDRAGLHSHHPPLTTHHSPSNIILSIASTCRLDSTRLDCGPLVVPCRLSSALREQTRAWPSSLDLDSEPITPLHRRHHPRPTRADLAA